MVAISCIVHRKRILRQVSLLLLLVQYEAFGKASDSRHWLQASIDLSCWMSPAMATASAPFGALALHVVYMLYRSLTIPNPTDGFVCMTLWSPGIVRRGSAWVILTLPIAVVYIGGLGIKCHIIDANHVLSPSITLDIPASFVILHCPFRWLFHLVDKKWVFFLVFFSSECGSWKGSFLV
jgi:hypothetical protein